MSRMSKLERMLEADPNDTFVLYGLAQELAKAGEHTRAIEFYDRCIGVDPHEHYAWYHKARSQEAGSDLDGARETLRAGLELAKKQGDAKAAGELAEFLDSIS